MKKSLVLLSFLFITSLLFGQGFAPIQFDYITGKVINKDSREPVPYAAVTVKQQDNVVGSTFSDRRGDFRVYLDSTFLEEEIITLSTNYPGYDHVAIHLDSIPDHKIVLELKENDLGFYCPVMFYPYLIDKKDPSSGSNWLKEDLDRLPLRK